MHPIIFVYAKRSHCALDKMMETVSLQVFRFRPNFFYDAVGARTHGLIFDTCELCVCMKWNGNSMNAKTTHNDDMEMFPVLLWLLDACMRNVILVCVMRFFSFFLLFTFHIPANE